MTIRTSARWCALGLYLAVITILSLLPGRAVNGISAPPGTDKLVHAGMYAGFVILGAWALWDRDPPPLRWLALTAVTAFAYGLLMELAQGALAIERVCSGADMLANAVGSALGALVWRAWVWAVSR